jgi:hypothetical protein
MADFVEREREVDEIVQQLTSVARGRQRKNPTRHVQKVMVVSQDLRQHERKATMPLMTQCQMASCWAMPNATREK